MSRRVPSQADPTYGLVAPVKRSLPPLRSLITLHESDTTQPRATSSPHDRSQRPSVSRHSSDSSWEASPHQHAEYSVTGYREDTIAENSADTEYQKAYAQHHALQYSPSPSQVVEYISSPVSAERWEDPAQRQYMTSHDNHKRVAPVSAPFIPRNTVVHINSSPTSGIWVSNPQELAHQVAYNRYEYTTRGHDPLPQETDLASPPAAIHSPPYSPQVQFEHWTPQQVAAIAYPAEQHLQQAHLSRDAHMSHNGAYDSSSQSPPMHYHVASTAHLHPLRHARYSQHPSDYEAASNTSVAPMSHQIGNELTGQQLDDKDFAENSPAISPPQLHASAIVPPVHMDPARHLAYAKIEGHCTVLTGFAERWKTHGNSKPSNAEAISMLTLAQEVADLLDQVKQTELSPLELEELDNSLGDSRGIKRSLCELTGGPQPTPAQDMEAIRFRRANAAGGNPVNVPIINTTPATTQLKVKYRKRGRGQPPTKCHSCNSRDTPEWRRGPDGARTLCNACGLHYAKLTRKREKSGGELPVIDIEMLRASARASETQLATEAKMRKTPKVRRSKDVNMLVDQTQDSPLPVATYQDPYQAMSEDSPMPPTSSPEPVQHQTIVQWGTVPTPHYRTQ